MSHLGTSFLSVGPSALGGLSAPGGSSAHGSCPCNRSFNALPTESSLGQNNEGSPRRRSCSTEPLPIDADNSATRNFFEAEFKRRVVCALPPLWANVASLPDECSVYCVSDIHMEMKGNQEWLDALPACREPNSVLLVAGDVHHDVSKLKDTLARLCGKYSRVFYVPGNHELWVTEKAHRNSVTKFFEILDICDQIGVLYVPAPVARRTRIYPLFTWHSADLGDPDVSPSFHEELFDIFCKWPQGINLSDKPNKSSLCPGIPSFFTALNVLTAQAMPQDTGGDGSDWDTITFSHFVPRRELYIGRTDLVKVMGDPAIDQQLRALQSSVHVFGHSHLNVDEEVRGVRYVQNALGNHKSFPVGYTPKLVWRKLPDGCSSNPVEAPASGTGAATATALDPPAREHHGSSAFRFSGPCSVPSPSAMLGSSQSPATSTATRSPSASSPSTALSPRAELTSQSEFSLSRSFNAEPQELMYLPWASEDDQTVRCRLKKAGRAVVMGDPKLDCELRQRRSRLHVFGQSQEDVDREVDGVRYVQHPLHRDRMAKTPTDYTPKLVWRAAPRPGKDPATDQPCEDLTIANLPEISVSVSF
eukprot:CAMPEP_0174308416 /NCGR_PEP_ID=MMETSP0810-20121108/1748_1 /TAXON_ID=73025 ORGANISM="Eutreptiella gymnastica-like, Strain CCMP1594" /NCGR_SAMPLE_ID=MMETSP0810 /ASSEMBLY_ACC=CAM_ASM_000659 /LENGTH=588 /DNA_ID=CAMNT_0015415747 /DNA_START=23 /DNA_END=1790 /DNA_ORIENTATION=+